MFNPNSTIIDAFVSHTLAEFQSLFGSPEPAQLQALEQAARTSLNTLLNCDCSYHDVQHTMLVTDAGIAILRGRQMARGDLTAHDWLQGVVAMLFHDVGYLRKLLSIDTNDVSVINTQGDTLTPAHGSTDACMTPYHVDRGVMYVEERFASDPAIDTQLVVECIEMTRFPVPPTPEYQVTDTLPALVRGADLIGQMADPQYLQKLTRLFNEFVETGEAQRLGFANASELRHGFPEFFYSQVHPYIGECISYLKLTQDGWAWIANLFHHLHANQELDPRVRAPELVVDNSLIERFQSHQV
ncbi:MAG: metal-dependent phosphohydrolase [Pseudomonadota bacterium]